MILTESTLLNRAPPVKPGFPTRDFHEPFTSNSGSHTSNTNPDEPNRKNSKARSRITGAIDERKRRRMMSNRESARRARIRKRKHLENLVNQLDRLTIENRELMNRVRFSMYNDELVRRENEQLRLEAVVLRRRLWDIWQILLVKQFQEHLIDPISAWPCNDFTFISEEQHCSTLN